MRHFFQRRALENWRRQSIRLDSLPLLDFFFSLFFICLPAPMNAFVGMLQHDCGKFISKIVNCWFIIHLMTMFAGRVCVHSVWFHSNGTGGARSRPHSIIPSPLLFIIIMHGRMSGRCMRVCMRVEWSRQLNWYLNGQGHVPSYCLWYNGSVYGIAAKANWPGTLHINYYQSAFIRIDR